MLGCCIVILTVRHKRPHSRPKSLRKTAKRVLRRRKGLSRGGKAKSNSIKAALNDEGGFLFIKFAHCPFLAFNNDDVERLGHTLQYFSEIFSILRREFSHKKLEHLFLSLWFFELAAAGRWRNPNANANEIFGFQSPHNGLNASVPTRIFSE